MPAILPQPSSSLNKIIGLPHSGYQDEEVFMREMRETETEPVYSYNSARAHPPKVLRPPPAIWSAGKPSLSRKLILLKTSRLLITIICTGCFIYYISIFFEMYGKYPTVVDVSVTFPDEPDLPAITVCNHNVLKKKELCDADPSTCSLLKGLPKNFSQVLRKKLATMPLIQIQNWTMNSSELFIDFKILNTENRLRSANDMRPSAWIYFEKRFCYVINVDWVNKIPYNFNDTDSELLMALDYRTETDFHPNSSGAEIYIHSPIGLPDSRTSHFTAQGGKSYSVGIQKTTLNLMEPPYQTMCTNYTKRFTNSRNADNLSKKICYTQCMAEKANNSCGCIPECMLFMESYMTNKSYIACTSDASEQEECCARALLYRQDCQKECPMECKVRLYDIQADQNYDTYVFEGHDFSVSSKANQNPDHRYAEVRINLQLVRHTIYTHNARITPIEILGYIGGYLGIWLGVSIPLLYDRILILLDQMSGVMCGKKKLADVIRAQAQSKPSTPPMPTSQQLYGTLRRSKVFLSSRPPIKVKKTPAMRRWASALNYVRELADAFYEVPIKKSFDTPQSKQ